MILSVYYSDQNLPTSIINGPSVFLAGPTPRSNDVPSWRPTALKLFTELNFRGNIFVPERRDGLVKSNYDDQVEWEKRFLNHADVILFWVPRKLDIMPAFTTNVEFGYYLAKSPDKVYYGRPDDSEKNRYLDWLYVSETGRLIENSLENLVNTVYKKL